MHVSVLKYFTTQHTSFSHSCGYIWFSSNFKKT